MVALTCNHSTGEVGDQQPPEAYWSASLTASVIFKLMRDPASKNKMESDRDMTSDLYMHRHTCMLTCIYYT